MSTAYIYRLHAIATLPVAQTLNAQVAALGIGSGNLSVELNASGDGSPATHLACSGLLTQSLVDAMAPAIAETPGVSWWRCDAESGALQNSSEDAAPIGEAFDFERCLSVAGLKVRSVGMG